MAYDEGGGGGGGGCRTTLPLIDEWGEIVLNDEMIADRTGYTTKQLLVLFNL